MGPWVLINAGWYKQVFEEWKKAVTTMGHTRQGGP